MAADTYVDITSGKLKQKRAINTNTGAANELVATDATGRINVNLLPTGLGVETITVEAGENLAQGDFVSLVKTAGGIIARKATAAPSQNRPAIGFVLTAVTAPASATIYTVSQLNSALAGTLIVGDDYWLDANPAFEGKINNVPPTGGRELVQYIGRANTNSSIVFSNVLTIELAP